jgi:hypothetical protein
MNRPILLIASRNAVMVTALHKFLNLFSFQGNLNHRIVDISYVCAAELFENLDKLTPEEVRETMVLIDLNSESNNPWNVQNFMEEQGLASQLILSYPEIYFAFIGTMDLLIETICPSVKSAQENTQEAETNIISFDREMARCHHFIQLETLITFIQLIDLHSSGFRTIFDPIGLRTLLKYHLLISPHHENADLYLPLLSHRINHAAASADEEPSFAYLNAYAAYKAGLRTSLLTTKKEFIRILIRTPISDSRTSINGPTKLEIILSDWCLQYLDFEGNFPDPYLLTQLDYFSEILLKVKVIVISSFEISNINFPGERIDENRVIKIQKPYGGLLFLLKSRINGHSNPLGVCFEQTWKTINCYKPSPHKNPACVNPHGAPYSRSLVANRLLTRARSIETPGEHSTELWVQKALLASEAKEILGGQSLTLSYECLALQNETEVQAEISFLGTSKSIEIGERLRKLADETRAIQFASSNELLEPDSANEMAYFCFMLQTTNNLRSLLAEREKFLAAEETVRWFAKYHLAINLRREIFPDIKDLVRLKWYLFKDHTQKAINLWRQKRGLGKRIFKGIKRVCKLFLRLPSWYLDFATRAGTSVRRLVCVSALWILLFIGAYALLLIQERTIHGDQLIFDDGTKLEVLSDSKLLQLSLSHSIFSFFELQPGDQIVQRILRENKFRDELKRDLITPSSELLLEPKPTPMSACAKTNKAFISVLISLVDFIGYRLWLFIELAVAYLHLGLLVSVLYRRLTKHAP